MTEHSNTERRDTARSGGAPLFLAPGMVMRLAGLLWLVFIAMYFVPVRVLRGWENVFLLTPGHVFAGPEGNPLTYVAPFIGHMLVHGDITHIAFNTLWLLVFGTPIARRFAGGGATIVGGPFTGAAGRGPLIQSFLFYGLFVGGGILGGFAFAFSNANTPALNLIGASGGVSALLGAVVRFGLRRPSVFARDVPPIIPLRSKTVIIWTLTYVLTNIAIGVFRVGLGDNGPDISWEAHLAGYFFGLVAFPVFDRLARSRS